MQKSLTNSSGKFEDFYWKVWRLLQENLTIFAGKSDEFRMKIVMKNKWTSWNLEEICETTFLAHLESEIIKLPLLFFTCSLRN